MYLLDDILSALDSQVAAHVVRHCVLGMLSNKTRIIVTEHRLVLAAADQVLRVENGSVKVSGVVRDTIVDEEESVKIYNGSTELKVEEAISGAGATDEDEVGFVLKTFLSGHN